MPAAAGGEIPIFGCSEMVMKIGELTGSETRVLFSTSALLANQIIGLDSMRQPEYRSTREKESYGGMPREEI